MLKFVAKNLKIKILYLYFSIINFNNKKNNIKTKNIKADIINMNNNTKIKVNKNHYKKIIEIKTLMQLLL